MPKTTDKPAPDVVKKTGSEIGATGIQLIGNTLFNTEDYNTDLQGQQGTRIFEEMRVSDPDVFASLDRFMAPIKSAERKMEPVDESAEEKEIAEFAFEAIFGKGGAREHKFLEHALLMLPFGFSAFEKVWGTDAEGRQVLRKLAPRLPKSVFEFEFDDDNELAAMIQYVWTPRNGWDRARIPVDKLALFVFGQEGDNYWGRPLLRSVYKPWYHKQGIEILDGIAHEKTGVGMLWIALPENPSDEQLKGAEKVSREHRAHERNGIVTIGDVKVEVVGQNTNSSSRVESMKYFAHQISVVLLVEWMNLGATEVGTRAVAGSKIDYALMAYQGTAKIIENGVDDIVRDVVERNYGARKKYPQYRWQALDKMSGDQLALTLKPLADSQLITPDFKLEEFLRNILDLPDQDEATARTVPVPGMPGMPGAPGAPGGPGKSGVGGSSQKTAPPQGKQPPGSKPPPQAKTASEILLYDPNQPRGTGDQGGQWVSGGGSAPNRRPTLEELKVMAAKMKEYDRGSGPYSGTSSTVGTIVYEGRRTEEAIDEIAHVVASSDFESARLACDSQTGWQGGYATADYEWLAANELGGNGSMFRATKESIAEIEDPKDRIISPGERKAFSARREWMQQKFVKEHGDKPITVYRGVKGAYAAKLPKFGEVDLPSHALSSWTTDMVDAIDFSSSTNGRILAMSITKEDVWLLPRRGVESPVGRIADAGLEIVVLNTKPTRRVAVLDQDSMEND